MNVLLTHLKKYNVAIFLGLVMAIIYILLRVYHLGNLPIFTDEAIYIRWTQIAENDAAWRFISLTDGKQPMLVWLMMPLIKIIEDPLIAGRLVSVVAGFFTMIGLFFLGREIFYNYKIGLISIALYVISPFALVYDRLALYDSLVGTFSVWSLYLEILLIRRLRLDVGLLLGMVMGGGVLTKSNGFLSIYLLPFSLLLLPFKDKNRITKLLKWVIFVAIAVIMTYGYYSLLRLSPYFHIIEQKNAIFIYPFHEWIMHPFTFFYGNLVIGQWNWFRLYMTLPVIGVCLYSFFVYNEYLREKLLLLVWFIVPFVLLALFGKVLYPRYIFFMVLPLFPLIALALMNIYSKIKNTFIFLLIIFLLFFLQLRADYYILFDFAHAPIPISDLHQYNNDWPSGSGVQEAVEFFKKEAEKGPIYIATQGTFGLMPYSLEIFLSKYPNITIEGYWPITEKIPEKVIEKSKKMPTYFVFYQPCVPCAGIGLIPGTWNNITVEKQIKKETPNRFFTIYKVQK